MNNDKLENLRSANKESSDEFYQWINENCVHAVSHEEARKITSKIKEPIKEVINA